MNIRPRTDTDMRLPLPFLATFLASCSALGSGGVDLAQAADHVALYRHDVEDAAQLASPETRARVLELAQAVQHVEAALRMASQGGSIDDVASAAEAALAITEALLPVTEEGSDARFAIALLRIVLRHVAAGDMSEVVPAQ